MPGSNRTALGNESYDVLIAPTSAAGNPPGTLAWSAATIAATTTAELTTTIPGAQVGDCIQLFLNNAAFPTGLSITNQRVSAPNTLAVTFANTSGGSVTIPTYMWSANVTRSENPGGLPPNMI